MRESLRNKIVLVLTLLTISLTTSGCNKEVVTVVQTEYVVRAPEKIERPIEPHWTPLNPNKSLDDVDEFTKLQKNLLKIKTYIGNLVNSIVYYETSIDELNKVNDELKEKNIEK